MVGNLTPAAVDPTTAPHEFWTRYHAYRRLRHAETRPDDPLQPDDIVEMDMKRDDPFEIKYRYEMVRDGVMLGWFAATTAKPGSPEYETNKHILWADASVHADHRRQGLGRLWIPLALELMDRHGCTTLSMGTEEDSGHAFLKWMGAEGRFSGAENRLKVSEVDLGMLRQWTEDAVRLSPDTRLETYDDFMPEEMWEDYCPQLTAMLNTMPWEEMDHGDIVVTPEQLAEWYGRMKMQGMLEYTMLTREPDGVISGITDMSFAPFRAKMIHQGFTGVRADARGRGLGKWLKAAMLLHVLEIYPDLEWVVTENAGSNAPMLAINTQMGFKRYRAGTEYQITRERLTKH
jgi:GNAT superfamily N-acetyltransferase